MVIEQAVERNNDLIAVLMDIWERSVKATHLFLSDEEIAQIKLYVPEAMRQVQHLLIARAEDGVIAGFMGIDGTKIEMLFLSPEARGRGIGRQMIAYGVAQYAVDEVTVNEQNPQAVGFYEHMGFQTYKRTELDEQGAPYPLLYMKLAK